jgi:hypothetical protein
MIRFLLEQLIGMITLFESVYSDKRSASASEIQFMLRLFQQDLKSVLLDVSYPTNEQILVLLNGGSVISVYHVKNEQVKRYSPSSLSDLLQEHERGVMRACDLTPSFFGAVRTMIEQSHPSKTTSLATSNLSTTIQKWQTEREPSFVHICWPNAEGFVFIPGNNFSARQYTFLSEDKLSDSAAAVSMFSHWSESECTVAQYTDDDGLAIWQENNQQLGFSLLLEHTLRRYDDLAGHSLALKLDTAINSLCRSHGWNIIVGNTTVDDVHIFATVDDAAVAYRSIFDCASRQIGQVIGSKLFNETVDTGLASLSEPLRQAVLKQILSQTFAVHA